MARGRTAIIDELTTLAVDRRRKWQLRRLRDGKCSQCGDEPLVTKTLGQKCVEKTQAHRTEAYRDQDLGKRFVREQKAQKKIAVRRTLLTREAKD